MLDMAREIVVVIIAVLVVALAGDYLGYKIGRRRLALISAVIALVTIVVFTVGVVSGLFQ